MLDLTLMNDVNLYEIKLADGRILKLKRPTQALQATIVKVFDKASKLSEVEMAVILFDTFTRILNRNTDGIEFDSAELAEEYGIEVAGIVIKDYFSFWNENTDVDFQ